MATPTQDSKYDDISKPLGVSGDSVLTKHTIPGGSVATTVCLTSKAVVVALDNGQIHVCDLNGTHQKILEGHAKGVWAIDSWKDTLVSGGNDCDVRVWSLETG